jgi:hypothetical protein
MTLEQFIAQQAITAVPTQVADNPHMTDMPPGSTHWHITLRRGRSRMTVSYSMGPAHTTPPALDDVLDSLASDAATMENCATFEEFCGELGYDSDSRRAERIYQTCRKHQARLLRFLGHDAYDLLLWHTERL